VDSEKPVRTIVADRGEILMNKDNGRLEIQLYDGSVSESQEKGIQSVQFKTYKFPTMDESEIQKIGKKKKDLTLAEILVGVGDESDKTAKREMWIIFHQRIAFSLGALIFVFIGIPIATIVRRGEVIISFGISMIATSIYYIFFATAQAIAAQGVLPPFISLWIPNIILLGLGTYLLRRAVLS